MELHNLEYVIAIYEQGGISKAAQKLYLTQPALSKSLLQLEHQLGLRLFNRRRDKLIPTPEGKLYIEAARKMVAVKNETNERIYQIINNTVYPQVRIGINNSAAIARLILRMVDQMQTETPVFFDVDSVECTRMIIDGQLDIVNMTYPDGVPDELECLFVDPEDLVVIVPTCPEFDPINQKYTDTIPIQALDGASYVQSRPDSGLGIIVDRYIKEHGISLNIACTISVLSAIMMAVESGVGITFMHRSNTKRSPLYRVYEPDPPLHYEHYLCIRKGKPLSPKAKRFLKLLWNIDLDSAGT